MIERMTHYTFLVLTDRYPDFLRRLQALGVLHVTPTGTARPADDAEFQAASARLDRLRQLLAEMRAVLKKEDLEALPPLTEGLDFDVAQIEVAWQQLCGQIRDEQQNVATLDADILSLNPWGDFSSESILGLEKAGWKVRFWTAPTEAYRPDWETALHAIPVRRSPKLVHFLTVTPTADGHPADRLPGATEVHLSPSPQSTLIMLQTRAKDDLKRLLIRQGDFALAHYREIEATCCRLQDNLALQAVRLTTADASAGRLQVLEGWVPTRRCAELDTELRALTGLYFTSRPATKADDAPIRLRNNAFARMYEVLTRMYGLPDYGEFDPTPLIAPFFTLFFGFCMGDAGYGLLFILLGILLKRKVSPTMRPMMNLVITLGVATTLMGALLGTCFGVDLTGLNLPESWTRWMVVGKWDGTEFDRQMLLALLIGVVHVCFAMVVKAVGSTVRYGFKESLSAWGWLLAVVGGLTVASLSLAHVISDTVTQWSFIAIGSISAIGIYLLNNLRRNIFVNIGAGLWDTYNMATGLLSDILSYVRLYALGLAGAMLGSVFNQLAFMARDGAESGISGPTGAVVGWIACGLILVFGHGLNVAMSCLSAFVHPLRLTFVEYFKNSGYSGKGSAYRPLAMTEREQA
jgi:V/A-type H+-transporting ATPase subunit I